MSFLWQVMCLTTAPPAIIPKNFTTDFCAAWSEIAVKLVDIFGNDMMTIVDVSVGKNGGNK